MKYVLRVSKIKLHLLYFEIELLAIISACWNIFKIMDIELRLLHETLLFMILLWYDNITNIDMVCILRAIPVLLWTAGSTLKCPQIMYSISFVNLFVTTFKGNNELKEINTS